MESLEKMSQEDEIDLLDLLSVFWRWKWMIAGVCMVFTLFALVITSAMPKVYRIVTVIEPEKRLTFDQDKQILDQKIIVSPAEISDVLLGGIFNKEIAEKLSLNISDIPEIKTKIIGSTNLLEISIESSDTQQGIVILNEFVPKISNYIQARYESDLVIEKQKKAYENEYQNKVIKMKLAKQQESQLQKDINRIEAECKQAVNNHAYRNILKFLCSKEVLDKQVYLNSLQEKVKDLELAIQNLEIMLATLQKEAAAAAAHKIIIHLSPTIEDKPVRTKALASTMMVFFCSLILSSILAVIIDKFRSRRLK
ncbi:MAG: hypothetical protein KKC46_14570 [Proteobacteria bacterium]|nr:hypothetical protein [Pseudomonadota bacterium]